MSTYYEAYNQKTNGIIYPFDIFKQEHPGLMTAVGSHYHEFIEMLYCKHGSYTLYTDNEEYTFKAGDLVIINSMEVHYVNTTGEGFNSYHVIRFSPELLYTSNQTIFEAKYVMPFVMKTSIHQKVFKQSEISSTPLPGLLDRIYEESQQKDYGFELAIRTSIGEVFLWIIRSWHEKGLDLNITKELKLDNIKLLEQVLDYIDNHYANEISAKEMAKLAGMSYSYFSRLFKKTLKKSFTDYVNLIRITKSEYMLSTTDKSITEIATSVGFSTSSYYIEQFKKFKSITPNKFRQRFEGN